MDQKSKIVVFGATGMVGSALVRQLAGYDVATPTRRDVDLTDQAAVNRLFEANRFEYVFLAAAKVGGIGGNSAFPADFGYANIMIQTNIIEAARRNDVKKLLFIGSSCIYPKFAKQPIPESELLSGYLEPTNEMYALAKIFGVKLCDAYRKQHGCDFISAMPSNLYGFGDTFDEENGHVIPALIMRMHTAKSESRPKVSCWGSGKPLREFLFVDDFASACIFLMQKYSAAGHINIGTGEEIKLIDLANLIRETIGYKGEIVWDETRPDGTPRKVLDTNKINNLGWKHSVKLREGLQKTYDWFIKNEKDLRETIS